MKKVELTFVFIIILLPNDSKKGQKTKSTIGYLVFLFHSTMCGFNWDEGGRHRFRLVSPKKKRANLTPTISIFRGVP